MEGNDTMMVVVMVVVTVVFHPSAPQDAASPSFFANFDKMVSFKQVSLYVQSFLLSCMKMHLKVFFFVFLGF